MNEIPSFWAGAIRHCGTLAFPELIRRAGGIPALQAGERALRLAGVPVERAAAWARALPERTQGTLVTFDDERYPERLRQISYPPPVLLVEGDVSALHGPAVAIVGTRRCTSYGESIARQLAHGLASLGVTVVSGLARGIDGQAHASALLARKTVAVLGHGLGHTAPSSHKRLREKILESSGAVVSTWLDTTEPRPHTFPERNAWISGLSDVVVVVEAPSRSGALLTAGAAVEQGREVVAVPGPMTSEESRGCLELIASGAGVMIDIPSFVARWGGKPPPQETWLQRLFLGATVDDVADAMGRSVRQVRVDLVRLEMEGKVVKLPGDRYSPGRGWR